MSDRALLSLKFPSLLVLLIGAVFKTTMRSIMEYLRCVTDRIAGKYYYNCCKICSTLVLSAINLSCIGPRSKPDLHDNIYSLLYAIRAYLAGNTRYSRAYPPSFIYFPLVREDLLTGCTNTYLYILSQQCTVVGTFCLCLLRYSETIFSAAFAQSRHVPSLLVRRFWKNSESA
jgi:hypothetical protein